jgi:hypothetical protein
LKYSFNQTGESNCPCKLCEIRTPGCHSRCEKYKAWKAMLEKRRKAEKECLAKYNTLSDDAKHFLWKQKRYSRQRRGSHGRDV